jgi:glutathione S-transferase
MLTVYGFSPSGNCHKVRLLLEQLGRPYRWVETDSARGATRTPEYLAKNPNGKVPILELDDGRVLAESNAILCWLADSAPASERTFLPADHWQRAQALAWMFFEQYSHEPHVAVARFIRGWTPEDSPRRAELPRLFVEFVRGWSGHAQARPAPDEAVLDGSACSARDFLNCSSRS